MSKLLKPERLNLDPQSPNAAKDWKYWFKTFENFIIMCGTDAPDKHLSLINLISSDVYEYVEDCTDYDSAKKTLEKLYVKSPNEVFARHLLATRRQQCSETLDVFFQNLRKLSKDCKFKAVSAEQYRDEMLRDAFINGLLSPEIRQRLLENDKLTMDSAFDKASSMDVAQRNASAYSSPVSHVAAASAPLNLHPHKRWRVVLLNYHPWLLLTQENSLSATFVVVAVIMSDVIALLVRLFVVTVESEGTIPNAACQRRKVLALRLLSILHYVLLVLLPISTKFTKCGNICAHQWTFSHCSY